VKALVTGASGFIGSHLVEQLLARGYAVRCLLRNTSSTEWLKDLSVEYVYGDLFTQQPLAEAVRGMDIVFHNAGVTKAKTREEYFRANAGGTLNLLNAVASENPGVKRFVLVSSQTAVGPSPTAEPITESASPHPITTYGKSKLQAEQEVLDMASRFPVTIVRPPAVYGPRDKDVLEFFRTMSKGLQPVVGFGEKYVSLIHAKDLARGIVLAAESPAAVGQTYFLTSKEVYGWKFVGDVTRKILGRMALRLTVPEAGVYVIATFAEVFAKFSPKPALINFEKAKDMVQDYWTCSGAKAKADFGFEQEISLEDGVRETIGWYKEKGWM
jgi:nucleoside-diphosphate-sugar epimerase